MTRRGTTGRDDRARRPDVSSGMKRPVTVAVVLVGCLIGAVVAPVGATSPGAAGAGAAPAAAAQEPPGDPGLLVDSIYRAMLEREPDAEGRAFWAGRFAGGQEPLTLVRQLGSTPEGRVVAVQRLYGLALGRAPDPGGRAFWAGRLRETEADLVAAFLAASTESYQRAGATPSDYIQSLYQRFFGRSADADGVEYWLGRFGDDLAGAPGRFRFASLIIQNQETVGSLARSITGSLSDWCEAEPTIEQPRLDYLIRFFGLNPSFITGAAAVSFCPAAAIEPNMRAGAASRSVLPTVDGSLDYRNAGLPADDDARSPGIFVPEFDQGQIDVGNGLDDAAWVHDDLRVTAVALEPLEGGEIVVMVSADVYMVFSPDAAEITARAEAFLPPELADRVRVVVSATHNHHGPETAFGVNPEWYERFANQSAAAVVDAIYDVGPAKASVADGEHRFGVNDARDPAVVDPRLNVLHITDADDRGTLATVVQWTSHPETTLNWEPPVDISNACEEKGWTGDECTAEGRYLTADYPGQLRQRLRAELGGEVLYFVGALGNQVGPGDAAVWEVDATHPVGDGWTVPDGAQPATPGADDYDDKSFAKTVAIGDQLAESVLDLVDQAEALETASVELSTRRFFTPLTNIGFRALLAEGGLGWQPFPLYTCEGEISEANCTEDGGATENDDLIGGPVRVGDVLRTQIHSLDLGSVRFLFMPGEVPPELVTGLPADYPSSTDAYHFEDLSLHASGEDLTFPGYLLDLVDEEVTFTVGLGGDELGYFTPLSDFRALCVADEVAGEGACQELFDNGLISHPDAVAGSTCETLRATGEYPDPDAPGEAKLAIQASCTYGQALGEADGHYEETVAAGWNMVPDLWAAAESLLGQGSGDRVNPDLGGVLPPDPESYPAPPGA